MNFNIYIEDNVGKRIQSIIKQTGKKKNEIVREAIGDWIKKYSSSEWSNCIINWQGENTYIEPESSRIELLPPNENIF